MHQKVLADITDFALNLGFYVKGITVSPILGADGNKEFFVYLTKLNPLEKVDIPQMIEDALKKEVKNLEIILG